jgi:hypothetical protein
MFNWFRRKTTPDPWLIAEAEEDGLPLLFRMREGVPAGVHTARYPHLVSIRWAYDGSATSGMPPPDELQRMTELEERLDALEGEETGYMMLSATGGGRREWLWYVADVEAYMDRLNEALSEATPYPVEFEASEEPAWATYHAIRGGAR